MNKLIIVLIVGIFSISSCQKVNPDLMPTESMLSKEIDTSLIYFDIPYDLRAEENAVVFIEDITTEEVMRNDSIFQVTIEYLLDSNNLIISLGVSSDFAESSGYNYASFIMDNDQVFRNYMNLQFKDQRGWLGRFFVGKVVNMEPCINGQRPWVNDPWWGNPYGGGVTPC